MILLRAPRSAVNGLGVFAILVCVALLLVPILSMAQGQGQSQANAQAAGPSVSLNQLANIIENDKTRAQLVAELRAAAKAQKAHNGKSQAPSLLAKPSKHAAAKPVPAAGKPAAAPQHQQSLARRFAHTTKSVADSVGTAFTTVEKRLTAVDQRAGPMVAFNAQAFYHAVISFVSVVVAAVVVFFILRLLAKKLFSVIGRFSQRGATRGQIFWHRSLAILFGVLVDAAIVLIAVNAGYLVGLFGFGENGTIGTRESLFLNAFALIEWTKVIIRALFAAPYENLRLLRMSSFVASWWSIRLRWFVGVIGYGMLVAVPIANQQLSFAAGALITFVVMGGTYVYALIVIFKNHRLLTQRLLDKAEHASLGFFAVLYRLTARIWVFFAVSYFTVLFIISQIAPEEALPFMLSASLQTVIAAAVGFGISGLLSKAIGRRITFSENLRATVPMLEARVNSYVPNALKVIRVVILLLVLAATANAWRVFKFGAWLNSRSGQHIVGIAVHVAIVLVVAALLWLTAASLIEHRLNTTSGHKIPTARQQTLLTLFRNILAIAIATVTAMIVLSQIGVNIGPLIASAGIFGLAIGFGAQTLVHDIINGIFIQLENAMNTGDVVELGGTWGTVERLTIRSVALRDIDGGYHIIPFSSVATVSNYMRQYAYFRTEYKIAFREDIDNAVVHLREAFTDLKADSSVRPNILEDMTIPGVTAIDDHSVNIRIMIKTVAGTQWGVGRALNRLVKIHFDRAGIEIPFPQQTLYFGEDRQGHAPPANLRLIDALPEDEVTPQRLRKRRRGDDPAPEATGDAPPGV
jgi:small conductance mechanosensitive channel